MGYYLRKGEHISSWIVMMYVSEKWAKKLMLLYALCFTSHQLSSAMYVVLVIRVQFDLLV